MKCRILEPVLNFSKKFSRLGALFSCVLWEIFESFQIITRQIQNSFFFIEFLPVLFLKIKSFYLLEVTLAAFLGLFPPL